jgi:hypothetical protein
MEIKKIDKWWVIWNKQKNRLVIDLFLENALYRALKIMRK